MSDQKVSFNYDALEPAARDVALEHARQIHQVLERTSAGIVEIGKRLLAAHEALGRDNFQTWLRAEFCWTQPVASNYESVARKFGELKCIDRFNPSALYSLVRANIDARVVRDAIKRAERGEFITRNLVGRLVRKYLPAAPAQPPALATGMRARAIPACVNSTVVDFRSFLRRVDVTDIPEEDRAALADELLELAMQLRTGRMRDGSPVPRNPLAGDTSPNRSRPMRRELARA